MSLITVIGATIQPRTKDMNNLPTIPSKLTAVMMCEANFQPSGIPPKNKPNIINATALSPGIALIPIIPN